MTTKTVEAWLLYKQSTGESSVRTVFLTKEYGVIVSRYKGGNTAKKKSQLQPFCPLWITIEERYGQHYVRSVETTVLPFDLQHHALFSAWYINEITYYALKPECPDEGLFEAYATTLNELEKALDKPSLEICLRRFEWALLQTCGEAFSFSLEARTMQRIDEKAYYRFHPGEGFVLSDSLDIPGTVIQALAEDDLSKIEHVKAAKLIMRQAVDHLLGGRDIKARKLYINT